jgi:hypothetical protein
MAGAKKRFWLVGGLDGVKPLYEAEFAYSRYSERQMIELMRLLLARETLTNREIAEAVGKRQSGLLHVHRSLDGRTFMCGNHPHFFARVVER